MACQIKPSVDPLSSVTNQKKFSGAWVMLTEREGQLVRFHPCDATNPQVILKEDSIYIHWGQDEASYKLTSSKPFHDKLLLTGKDDLYQTEEKFFAEYINPEKKLVRWYVWLNDTTSAIFTDNRNANHYPHIAQPCAECWGNDLCDEVTPSDSLVMASGDIDFNRLMVVSDF